MVMTSDGFTFSDSTTRSNRPLTAFASATLTSSINSVNSVAADYVNITITNDVTNKGLPEVAWTFDYWTVWSYSGYPWYAYVTTIERHYTSGGTSYVRVGITHSANGGPHVYTIYCIGNYFSP
jgi:hypothetical protein